MVIARNIEIGIKCVQIKRKIQKWAHMGMWELDFECINIHESMRVEGN